MCKDPRYQMKKTNKNGSNTNSRKSVKPKYNIKKSTKTQNQDTKHTNERYEITKMPEKIQKKQTVMIQQVVTIQQVLMIHH